MSTAKRLRSHVLTALKVIPANAGIQSATRVKLDSRVRENDETMFIAGACKN